MKKVTITLNSAAAHWARKKATEENISVSKLLARILAREMRASDSYWRAFEDWKRRDRDLGAAIRVSRRFKRDQAHER